MGVENIPGTYLKKLSGGKIVQFFRPRRIAYYIRKTRPLICNFYKVKK